jgi:hypothetical protein
VRANHSTGRLLSISLYPASDPGPELVSPTNTSPTSSTFAAPSTEHTRDPNNSASEPTDSRVSRTPRREAFGDPPEIPRTNYPGVMDRLDYLADDIRLLGQKGSNERQEIRNLLVTIQFQFSREQSCPCLRQRWVATGSPTSPLPATEEEAKGN